MLFRSFISLIAPTSKGRIATIAKEAKGFVYCVSSLGVTGTRSQITTDISSMVSIVRNATDIPVAVGFGISTPDQASQMAKKADGIIIGSAIVKIVQQYGTESIQHVYEYIKTIKNVISH